VAQCTGKNNLDSTITLSGNTNDSLSVLSRKSQVEQTTNVQETYSLIVFPNPNSGQFEIIIPNENGSLQITNINGIEIYSQLINIKNNDKVTPPPLRHPTEYQEATFFDALCSLQHVGIPK
jgi:hypothetical protein